VLKKVLVTLLGLFGAS